MYVSEMIFASTASVSFFLNMSTAVYMVRCFIIESVSTADSDSYSLAELSLIRYHGLSRLDNSISYHIRTLCLIQLCHHCWKSIYSVAHHPLKARFLALQPQQHYWENFGGKIGYHIPVVCNCFAVITMSITSICDNQRTDEADETLCLLFAPLRFDTRVIGVGVRLFPDITTRDVC